jgi:hypothetical protein
VVTRIGKLFEIDYCDVINMTDAQIRYLLEQMIQDIQALPSAAVPLVGALVALQEGLPPWLRNSS